MVSIVIPVYNAESFILETLESVYTQSHQKFEIIIINDGSTDSTRDILEKEAAKHSFIKLIHKENSGVADARNIGMELAQANYIALLDADDTWEKNNLEKKIKFLETNPEYSWVFSNMNCIAENSDFLRLHPEGRDDDILHNILLWEGEVVPGPCSNIVFASSLKNSIAFDRTFSTAADQDFSIQLARTGKGKFLKDQLVNYRVLANSMSRDIATMERDHIAVYKKAALNDLFGSAKFERKCFSNLYKILAGSWWNEGGKKLKGLKFIFKSIITYPPIVRKYFT